MIANAVDVGAVKKKYVSLVLQTQWSRKSFYKQCSKTMLT